MKQRQLWSLTAGLGLAAASLVLVLLVLNQSMADAATSGRHSSGDGSPVCDTLTDSMERDLCQFVTGIYPDGLLTNWPNPRLPGHFDHAPMRDYGENLGMGFQIVDDVLDFVSDEDQLGKPAGSDLRAGLVTAPTLWFLQQNENHDLVQDILRNGRRDDGSIMTAVRDIRESGAIEASLDEARRFIERSREALEILPPGTPRDALRELSDFVVERSW